MIKIISVVIYICVRIFQLTYRYRFIGNENLKNITEKKQNFIFAIWHKNLFGGILAQTKLSHVVMISKSNDAEVVAFTCKQLGHFVVRGSSKKGGVDKGGSLAADKMVEYLKSGHPGAVTVDGPKGPALKVKPGIINMAKQSQAAIVPYTVCSNSYWEFNSWDRFQLPKPFSKLLVVYGKPIFVPLLCSEFESYQNLLEKSLNELAVSANEFLPKWNDFSFKNWYE